MENKINENCIFNNEEIENKINENNNTNNEEIENMLNSFISEIQNKYNEKDNNIRIIGKILYYLLDNTIIYFNYKILKQNKNNLFNKDILFGFEFIQKKVPYIRILSNFITPTLYDGRNLFYCLLNDYDNSYVFDKNNLEQCNKIIEQIIIGIKKFILNLKVNIEIKVLINYGEYTLNHIYLMNDFLMNQTILNFFRIYELNNKNKELKYILITQIYFLIFEPINENKSLGKLIQIYSIKNVNFIIENNSKNKNDNKLNNYYFKINNDSNKLISIKFILTYGGNQGKKVVQKNYIESDYNDDLKLKKVLEEKKNALYLGDYLLVIEKSKNLYAINEKRDSNKKKFISKKRCSDYKKYIEYYELLYDYYDKKKDKEDVKDKLKEIFSYLTFFCVELITFKDSDPKENVIYKSKLEKFSKYCLE